MHITKKVVSLHHTNKPKAMNLIKYRPTLKLIAKKYSLTFCTIYGYYEGNAYNNDKGETLPNFFELGGRVYKLTYVSGCFNPFLEMLTGTFAYSIETKEPLFRCAIDKNPNQDKFYISGE